MTEQSEQELVNVICLKWGTRYPASFTNRLYRSVKKYLHRPFRFVCVTEDPTGLDEGIDVQPFPENPSEEHFSSWPGIFMKLCVFKDGFCNLKGPTLFMDVDVAIMGDLDCFFDYKPGENCIIHNWIERRKAILRKRPDIGNSSCFRFEAGKSNYIYETFIRELDDAIDHSKYTTEQAFMTHAMKTVNWWPEEWVLSFKRSCVRLYPFNLLMTPPEPKCRILVFHGRPDPDQALVGYQDVKKHHNVLPCPWLEKYWNV